MSISERDSHKSVLRNIGAEIFISGVGSWIAVKGLERFGTRVSWRTALTVYWGHRLVEALCGRCLDRVSFGHFPSIQLLTFVAVESVCLQGRVTLGERHFGLSPLVTLALYGLQGVGTCVASEFMMLILEE